MFYIYQGEEIGMINLYFICIIDYCDVESYNMFVVLCVVGCDFDELLVILVSKFCDNSCMLMQWDNGKNVGFIQGELWISLCDNYMEVNVVVVLCDKNLVFYIY